MPCRVLYRVQKFGKSTVVTHVNVYLIYVELDVHERNCMFQCQFYDWQM